MPASPTPTSFYSPKVQTLAPCGRLAGGQSETMPDRKMCDARPLGRLCAFVGHLQAHDLFGREAPVGREMVAHAELEGFDVSQLARQVIMLLFRVEIEIVQSGIGKTLQYAREAAGTRRVRRIVAGGRQHHLVFAAAQAREGL